MKHIHWIDDSKDLMTSMSIFLDLEGYKYSIYYSFEDFKKDYTPYDTEYFIVDYELGSDLFGDSIVKYIRQVLNKSASIVIGYSGLGTESDVIEAYYKAGADTVFAKGHDSIVKILEYINTQ